MYPEHTGFGIAIRARNLSADSEAGRSEAGDQTRSIKTKLLKYIIERKVMDFSKHLNAEQLAAVTAPDGPILVLAAAGTGKTRTLVYRVAHLIERGVPSNRILLATFTNKAAREMLERARDLVGPAVNGVWGGTFHHVANRMLRRHADMLGYGRNFVILDRDDSKSLVSTTVKDKKLQSKEFPKSDILLGMFGTAANTESKLADLFEDKYQEYILFEDQILAVHKEYERRKREMDAMDFDDLLVNSLKLLREQDTVLKQYQDKFQYVLVDEYQDTNSIQAEMIDRIAGGHRNIMVVGDDFQSIYSWRGANYFNIMSFPKRYPGAKKCILETNYRSVPEILNVANKCIAGNPNQFQKILRATRQNHKKPSVVRLNSGMDQAEFVVNLIKLLCGSGYKPSDIAVLYRAHFHAMELQMVLTKARIDYLLTSGVRFFEQAHIKDVCALLRMLVFPEDEISFRRLLGLLPGVGPRTSQKAWESIDRSFKADEAVCITKVAGVLKGDALEIWRQIAKIIQAFYEEDLDDDPGEVVYRFVKVFYERYMADNFQDYARRADDIQEMVLYSSEFDNTSEFLSDIALMTNLDAEAESFSEKDRDVIRLSTVHQAKGLEWPVVILLWMAENMFPSSRSLAESEDGEAEERRLFYVAVTRAKDDLYMCVPQWRRTPDGGVIGYSPSRFIAELPGNLVQTVKPSFF